MDKNPHLLQEIYAAMMDRFDKIDSTLDRMNRVKVPLDGDTLLDNQDLCTLLGVTKRTLARYRQRKIIRYYMIDGKAYYKSSEIKEFMQVKGKPFDEDKQ